MRFGSIDELDACVGERCRQRWVELRHPECKPYSVAKLLEHERGPMTPRPRPVTRRRYVPITIASSTGTASA